MKRARQDDMLDLLDDGDLHSTHAKRADVPALERYMANKYPGLQQAHEKFYAFANKYNYHYAVKLNFDKLSNGKATKRHLIRPYQIANKGRIKHSVIEKQPDIKSAYHKICLASQGLVSQFCYVKDVYDHIHSVNTSMALEFKNLMGMLKQPEEACYYLAKCGTHYHMLLFTQENLYATSNYKKANGSTLVRSVASSTRNIAGAGKLDIMLHLLYLIAGEKMFMGVVGTGRQELIAVVRDVLRLKVDGEDVSGIKEDGYDQQQLMQLYDADFNDLNIPIGADGGQIEDLIDVDDDLLSCKISVGDIRNSMADSCMRKFNETEDSKAQAKVKPLIDCIVSAGTYDMTDVLLMLYKIPYLNRLFMNPNQNYQKQVIMSARAMAVHEVGIRQTINDLFHESDVDFSQAHYNLAQWSDGIINLMMITALKIVQFEKTCTRDNYILVHGPPNCGKTWLFTVGLRFLVPHHSTLSTEGQFAYKELAEPGFYAISDDFNTSFTTTRDVEQFKKVIGGQDLSVQDKGQCAVGTLKMPIILLSNFEHIDMQGIRGTAVQKAAIESRRWYKYHMTKQEIHRVTVDELQAMWLLVLYQALMTPIESEYKLRQSTIDSMRKKLSL